MQKQNGNWRAYIFSTNFNWVGRLLSTQYQPQTRNCIAHLLHPHCNRIPDKETKGFCSSVTAAHRIVQLSQFINFGFNCDFWVRLSRKITSLHT